MRLEDAKLDGDRLSFKVNPGEARKIVYKFKAGEYEISPVKKKRSINANDFCWSLCTQIADAVGITKEDVYRDAISHVGIFKDFHGIDPDDARTLRTAWERLGTGWITEQLDFERDGEKVIIRAYYGSSQYNTAQMSRLIDWLKQECESIGIDVDDERIKSLLQEWEK